MAQISIRAYPWPKKYRFHGTKEPPLNPLPKTLLQHVAAARTVPELSRLAEALTGLWLAAAHDQEPAALGVMVSDVADAITRRLLIMTEKRIGPPPVSYAWIAYGSQGRRELTLNSDQDNALVLDDRYEPSLHADYFAAMGEAVCDGLAACGFIHCPGDMMASNPRWRMRQADWCNTFADWITACDPQKARLAGNFFDLRHIHGDHGLVAPLENTIRALCPKHDSLLAHWVANANSAPPALGIFRRFITDHNGLLDLKRAAIIPLVELARIHCLAAGTDTCGTTQRLVLASGRRWLSSAGAKELGEAFGFTLGLRVRQQRQALMQGKPAGNLADPATLTAGEQERLRGILGLIVLHQRALLQAYPYMTTR